MRENSSNENTKLISDIEEFLYSCGSECLKTFRYFQGRAFNAFPEYAGRLPTRLIAQKVETHIETILITWSGSDSPVAYGHLDKCQEGKVWLGVCVADDAQGFGLGEMVVKYLLSKYDKEIYLSVDCDNERAIRLYKKHGFETTHSLAEHNFMRRR